MHSGLLFAHAAEPTATVVGVTAAAKSITIRLPRSAYLTVLFLLFCAAPIALTANGGHEGGPIGWSWRVALLIIPVLAAIFIARTATVVSAEGLRVRAAFGSRMLGWEQVRGLSVTDRSVYAVLDDGAVRLPCVRTADLSVIAEVSGGRLPDIPPAVRKFAPSRRRTRRVRRPSS
jgi:hypothetical protein